MTSSMTIRTLQEELEKERAVLKAAKDRIAAQNKELEAFRAQAKENTGSEGMLQEANIILTELVSNLQHGIFATDEHRNVVLINDLFCKQFGINVPAKQMISASGAEIIQYIKDRFVDPDEFVAGVDKILSHRKAVFNEELKLMNGLIYARDFIPIFTEGNYKGHVWKYTDITRNKTIGDTFETQRKFYEQILNNIPSDLVVYDTDLTYRFINPTAVSKPDLRRWMIGKTNEEYCVHTNKPMKLAETRRGLLLDVLNSKEQKDWEEKFTMPDGSDKYHLRKLYPVLNDKNNVEMLIGYGVDITDIKKIEEHVHLSEKRYREIFNFSQAWIGTHDLQGILISMNPSACQILGYEEKELLGRNLDSLIPAHLRPDFANKYLKQIITEGKAEGIMHILSKESKNIYLLYQNYLVNEPGSEPYIIGFAQDITQRIYAEEALKKSEEKYKGIIENMNLGMIELDTEDRIIYANQRFCTMSGYDVNELISKNATDLFLRGASLKRTRNQLSKREYGITSSYELAVKTKAGEDKWWLTSATPLFTTDEKLKGTISIHLDITQQKKLEEQLREAKQDADRSSMSKDIFLTNMSHEIRTPLNAIMGLGRLLGKSELNPQQKNYLNGIESASSNLLGIINDLLDFSKIEAGKITLENISFNLETVSKQAITILAHKAEEKGLVLTSEIDPRIAPVLIGDPYRINQVFMNMLSNAIKFTEKGSIYLKAFLLEQYEDSQKVLVLIEDTGVGIKQEYLDNIFDKFTQEDETVVRKFGGTGLGMSITKQLLELMGGAISVTSKKNVGTTISLTFSFKVGTSRVFEKKKTIKNETSNINNKKILLVEDNSLNRLLAYTILTDYGALVLEAENGLEAIKMLKSDTFDIVLMDIQMPVMDGIQATKIIRSEISTTLPVLALTANAIKGKENQFLEAGMNDFIFKPYNEMNLVNPIAKWLNKSDNDNTVDAIGATQTIAVPQPRERTIPSPPPAPATPAEPLPPSAPLYDLGKLINMGRNDQEFIKKMLRLFISETPPSVDKIVEAYKVGDFDSIKYYAHRMKPSITNLGIETLKEEIVKIEFVKDKGADMDLMINKLDTTIAEVVRQLKVEYNL